MDTVKLTGLPSLYNSKQVSDCLQISPARLARCRRLGEILVDDVLPSFGVKPDVIEKIKNGTYEEEDSIESSENDGNPSD